MSHRFQFLVGIDWATQAHQVCVLDADGRLLVERPVSHSGQALTEFADWLLTLVGGEPALTAVAIEVPRGAVVELLVERGFEVYALNPKQLDRFRDRHTVAGSKDDRRDALVLADSLRTDLKSFRRVALDDPRVVEVRELTRIEEDLRVEFSRLSNRLREQLHRYYPQLLKLVPAADEPWLWALLELAPTPEEGRRLRVRRVERLLAEHRIRRLSAGEVIAALKAAPLPVAAGAVAAGKTHGLMLIERLRLVHEQRKECADRLDALLDELSGGEPAEDQPARPSDVAVLRSIPGVGRVVASVMLAEAAPLLAARDYESLRAPRRGGAGDPAKREAAGGGHAARLQYALTPGALPLGAE